MAITPPSAVLQAIADRLREELGPLVKEVRPHDGNFGADGKDNVTVASPGVLVLSTGGSLDPNGYEPPVGQHRYVATVIARAPDRERGQATPADVASDLAWLIATIVETEMWGGVARKQAERVQVINEHTNGLTQKGIWVWSVTWLQEMELPRSESRQALLQSFRKLHFDFYQGDVEQVPQHEAMVELNGAEVPEEGSP